MLLEVRDEIFEPIEEESVGRRATLVVPVLEDDGALLNSTTYGLKTIRIKDIRPISNPRVVVVFWASLRQLSVRLGGFQMLQCIEETQPFARLELEVDGIGDPDPNEIGRPIGLHDTFAMVLRVTANGEPERVVFIPRHFYYRVGREACVKPPGAAYNNRPKR